MGHQEMQGPLKTQLRDLIENSAVTRVGAPSDIANAVGFLCSPEASFITGEDILMDGRWASSKRWVNKLILVDNQMNATRTIIRIFEI
jgi:NAD(P)-dependent dehydrogenase (short-subunit alcohol dehydrogenase family)